MDRERIAPVTFAQDAQAIEASILVEIFHVDGGSFRLGDRVGSGMIVTHEMLEQAGECSEPPANGGGFGTAYLVHDVFPRNHCGGLLCVVRRRR
jgi:hypothetical protein